MVLTGLPTSDRSVSPWRAFRAVVGLFRMSNFGVTTGRLFTVWCVMDGVRRVDFRRVFLGFEPADSSEAPFLPPAIEPRWLGARLAFALAESFFSRGCVEAGDLLCAECSATLVVALKVTLKAALKTAVSGVGI